MNRILFLSSKTNQQENSFFAQAKTQLSSCENQYLKFDFQSSDFCDADVLEKAKTANAILFLRRTIRKNVLPIPYANHWDFMHKSQLYHTISTM